MDIPLSLDQINQRAWNSRDGSGFQDSISKLMPRFTHNPLRFGWRTLRALRALPFACYNYMRHARFHRNYEGYSIKTAAAHFFGILIVYTTLTEQRRQLASLGFVVEAVFGCGDGTLIDRQCADERRVVVALHRAQACVTLFHEATLSTTGSQRIGKLTEFAI